MRAYVKRSGTSGWKWSRRQRVFLGILLSALLLLSVTIAGMALAGTANLSDLSRKNLEPGIPWLFGTDWLGRDLFARTMTGLSVSIRIGMMAAAVSAGIALVLGVAAAVCGRWVDEAVSFLIDLIMGIPHILLLILIAVSCGRGMKGVVAGVALTHWPALARLIRAEVIGLRESTYVQIARKLGHSRWYVARVHMLPHLAGQFLVGVILLFPHAILHEASVTFLGFGLSAEQPAIGNILSESMRYLITGSWWLALFPGVALAGVVAVFYALGEHVKRLVDPGSVHE